MKKNLAIIGAGISGLTLGQRLKDCWNVVVYEKARGVGGRMSTRHANSFDFDHGTQCFTARTPQFQNYLKPYIEEKIVGEWKGKVINLKIGKETTTRLWSEQHLVANPNMNSLCKILAKGIDIKIMTEVAPLVEKSSNKWVLYDVFGNKLGEHDWVVSTAPPEQTSKLFGNVQLIDSPFDYVKMQACYSLMIGLDRPWEQEWIAAKVHNNPIKWISINSTKPSRNKNLTAIVAHTRNNWAEARINQDIKNLQTTLVKHFEEITDISCKEADYIATHRWKYAIVKETQKPGFYFNYEHKIAASSDWASTSRIEEVWLNATGLANYLKSI